MKNILSVSDGPRDLRVNKAFCFALAFYMLEQLLKDRLAIAAGEVLPRGFVTPFGGTTFVIFEYLCFSVGLFFLWTNKYIKPATILIFALGLVELLQNFSNHGLLLFLGIFYLGFSNWKSLIKFQLVLLYVLAGANKLADGFYNGNSLENLFYLMQFQGMKPMMSLPSISWSILGSLTIAIELLLAPILLFIPRLGFGLSLCFHLAMNFFMPGLSGFLAVIVAYLSVYLIDFDNANSYSMSSKTIS